MASDLFCSRLVTGLDMDKSKIWDQGMLDPSLPEEVMSKKPVPCPHCGHMPGYDLMSHIKRQKTFSENTFGPGARTKAVLDHIRKELLEIEAAPNDLEEWVDVIMLALDGAWRSGSEPKDIAETLKDKLTKNENREWPDWKTAEPDKAIEHVRQSTCNNEHGRA